MSRQTRKPTMKDVAVRAEVSVTTVSHVLNQTRFVSAEVTQKVEETIAELDFRLNPIAQNLRSGRSQVLGFVVANLQNYFYTSLARGMKNVANAKGYRLVLADSAEDREAEREIIESFYLRGLDGIIVAPTSTDCQYLEQVVPSDYPVVFVDRPPGHFRGDCVLLNNVRAARDATAHLLSCGYRRIGYLTHYWTGAEVDATTSERIEGYRQALLAAGLAVEEGLIHSVPCASLSQSELLQSVSYSIARELVAASVDAVLCGNSLAAMGLCRYLQDAGIRIPEDIALISFDDDAWLSLVSPQITAVAQPAEQMGELAAQQLLRRIREKTCSAEVLRLEAQIIHRDSC